MRTLGWRAACAAFVFAALASTAGSRALPPEYDLPLPAVLRVCVEAYAPFVMQRVRAAAGAQACKKRRN
jgi:hypothetical protein